MVGNAKRKRARKTATPHPTKATTAAKGVTYRGVIHVVQRGLQLRRRRVAAHGSQHKVALQRAKGVADEWLHGRQRRQRPVRGQLPCLGYRDTVNRQNAA